MDLWASFSNSGVYLAVLAGGYLLKRAGLFRVQDARFLSAVIMNITLPAAIVKGFAGVELSGVLLLTFVFPFGEPDAGLHGCGAFPRASGSGTGNDDPEHQHIQLRKFRHPVFIGRGELGILCRYVHV